MELAMFPGNLLWCFTQITTEAALPSSKPSDDVEDLEKELELDLENMKIDENIDTSVSFQTHPRYQYQNYATAHYFTWKLILILNFAKNVEKKLSKIFAL